MPFFEKGEIMIYDQIDWEVIKMQHITWRMRFRSMLNSGSGKLEEIQVKDHTQCDMGKWMHSTGIARYGEDPAFKILLDRHKEFHDVAAKGYNAYTERNLNEANHYLNDVTKISDDMLQLIDVFKAYLEKKTVSSPMSSSSAKSSDLEGIIKLADAEKEAQDKKFFGKDYKEAIRLYTKAAAMGSEYATEMLKRIK